MSLEDLMDVQFTSCGQGVVLGSGAVRIIRLYEVNLKERDTYLMVSHIMKTTYFGRMKLKNLKIIYVDAVLSADALEKFRNKSLSTYGLCPYHYLSTLALVGTQCSILKKVELKFIPDLVHELELKKTADLASMGGET